MDLKAEKKSLKSLLAVDEQFYFLKDANALPDHESDGLTDDAAVVHAATVALVSK